MAAWKGPKLPWADDIDDDHYDSAQDFLSLQWNPERAASAVDRLRDEKLTKDLPGDLLRAAGLPPLPLTDNGVAQEIRRALIDGDLVPLLIVNLPVGTILADGYHRASAAYHLAPFHKIPLKIVDATPEEMGNEGDHHGKTVQQSS